jgi:hypothetical protein
MEGIPPEVWQALLQTGGVPLVLLAGLKWIWNGTTKKLDRIEACITKIDRRLFRLEIHAGLDEIPDEDKP